MRKVACRQCGRPNAKGLCDLCRDSSYNSKEYRDNAALVTGMARMNIRAGLTVRCCLCGQPIVKASDVSVEHERPAYLGGSNDISNLNVAHRLCNYAKK